MKTRILIGTLLASMLTIIFAPAILVAPASAAANWNGDYRPGTTTMVVQYGGYTNGYWRGPRDGQCWNNKRGC